jgi:hypothetical protein
VVERDRWAPGAITSVRAHYQSFQGRATVIRCKDVHSKHEVDTLSAICDATLAGRSDVVLEIAIRRIIGVEDADNGGGRDWDVAAALDIVKPGAFGSDDLRRRLRKDAAQIKANRVKSGTVSRTTAGTGGKWNKKKGGQGNGGGGSGARRGGSSSATTSR